MLKIADFIYRIEIPYVNKTSWRILKKIIGMLKITLKNMGMLKIADVWLYIELRYRT